jgi:hypothetical protein
LKEWESEEIPTQEKLEKNELEKKVPRGTPEKTRKKYT